MRLFLKILGAIVAVILLIPLALLAWVYFYTGSLPDVTALQAFVPSERTQAALPYCESSVSSTAIPAYEMARFRDALIAAEGDPKDMAALRDTVRTFVIEEHPRPRAQYSARLASQLNCPGSRLIEHQIKRVRTAIQIERRFKADDILTIYANSVYFGNETYGIENASQRYFKKKALQLSIVEDAFLAGLIQSPSRFLKSRERAIERRNGVLDRMAALQMISAAEAEKAKGQPLELQNQ